MSTMQEALLSGIDGLETQPRYYVRCEYCWPEFVDMGAFTYTQVRHCNYLAVECDSEQQAISLAASMKECICPRCGKKGKFAATTDLDLYNENQMLLQLNEGAANAR